MKKKISMHSKGLTLKEVYALFMKQGRARNLSEATLTDYEVKLTAFLSQCGDLFSEELSAEKVDDFIISLKNRQVKDTTIQSYMRAVSVFCHFAIEEGYCDSFKIHLPKAETPIKDTYSDSELALLLEKPNIRKCSFAELRTWALICFLTGTGCRIGTALNVRIADIDFESGLIQFCKTKNRKSQVIPLSSALSVVLREYLRFRNGQGDDYLFCTECGEQATVSGIQSAVKRYNRSRGVSRGSLHAFRHTFARHYIRTGGDAFRLQRLMGHHDISQTKAYVTLFSGDLQQGFDDHNFLDRLNKKQRISLKDK